MTEELRIGMQIAALFLLAFAAGGIAVLVPLMIGLHRKLGKLPKKGDRYDG